MRKVASSALSPILPAAWRKVSQGPVRSRADERRFIGEKADAKHNQASVFFLAQELDEFSSLITIGRDISVESWP